jgi:hypothetical protein
VNAKRKTQEEKKEAMKIIIGIPSDSKLISDLFETKDSSEYKKIVSDKQEKTIAEGVSIQYLYHYAADAVDIPTLLLISAYIGEHVVLPVAAGLLSRYLYDKLKDRKTSKITINDISVEFNAEKIQQLILTLPKEKKNQT